MIFPLCHQVTHNRAWLLIEKVSVVLCPYYTYRSQLTEENRDTHASLCENHPGELDTPNVGAMVAHRDQAS